MENITVAKLASTLMNMIAEHPETAEMSVNVELREGKEYASIVGIESVYHCKFMDGKIKMTPGLTIKLEYDQE